MLVASRSLSLCYRAILRRSCCLAQLARAKPYGISDLITYSGLHIGVYPRRFMPMSTTTNMQDLVDRLDATREDEVLAVADQLYQVPWNHTVLSEEVDRAVVEQFAEKILRTGASSECSQEKVWPTLLRLLGKVKRADVALAIESMLRNEGKFTIKPLLALLETVGFAGLDKETERLFLDFLNRGLKPDSHTFNSVLWALVNANRMEDAMTLIDIAKKKAPHVVSFRVVMKGLLRLSHNDEALALFRSIKDMGMKPCFFIYVDILAMFARAGDAEAAQQIFDEMQKEGFQPTRLTYLYMMMALLRSGQTDAAMEMFERIKQELTPTLGMYNNLIFRLARQDKKKACRLFNEMRNMGIKPDLRTYTTMFRLMRTNSEEELEQLCLNEVSRHVPL